MNTRAIILFWALWFRDESALRETFDREIKAKEPNDRVEALKKLAGAKEEPTIDRLTGVLKDPDLAVRKAAAETIGASTDGEGKAIKPLGEILVDKKQDLELRLACAKALAKSRYKAEPFKFFLKAISEIDKEEREFHPFGFQVAGIIDKFVGVSFGADMTTVDRWEGWWSDNQEKILREDGRVREEWRKKRQ